MHSSRDRPRRSRSPSPRHARESSRRWDDRRGGRDWDMADRRRSKDRSPRRRSRSRDRIRSGGARVDTRRDGGRAPVVPPALPDRSTSLYDQYVRHAGPATAASSTGTHALIRAYTGEGGVASALAPTDPIDKPRELTDRPAEQPRFKCSGCGFHCHYDSFGTSYRAIPGLRFKESVFLLRDPLRATVAGDGQVPGVQWPLVLGGKCGKCNAEVCCAKTCSVFDEGRRLCTPCLKPA